MQYGLKTVTLHGSGEPTLNRDMPKFVRAVKERGLTCISFTNGLKLTEQLSQELIDAGIDILRLSCIGYDEDTYHEWMEKGDYDVVRNNASVRSINRDPVDARRVNPVSSNGHAVNIARDDCYLKCHVGIFSTF